MKKITISFIFFSLLFVSKSNAQVSWGWAKGPAWQGGLNYYYDVVGQAVVSDKSGNIISAGSWVGDSIFFQNHVLYGTPNPSAPGIKNSNAFILKNDSLGNILWVKEFQGKEEDLVTSTQVDDSGNIYVCGVFESDTLKIDNFIIVNQNYVLNSGNNQALFLCKLDKNGNAKWMKGFSGSLFSWWSTANIFLKQYQPKIILDDSNNIILGAYLNQGSIDFGGGHVTNLVLSGNVLVKFNAAGICQWLQTIPFNNSNGRPSFGNVATDHSGNIYFSGTFYDLFLTISGNILINNGSAESFFVKYSPSGNVLFAKSNGGTKDELCYNILTTKSNEVYLLESSSSDTVVFDNHISVQNNPSGNYAIVAKYDSIGNYLWSRYTKNYDPAVSPLNVNSTWLGAVVDDSDNIILSGQYIADKVFFDNDSIIHPPYLSYDSSKVMVGKYNKYGQFQWAITENSTGYESGYGFGVCLNPSQTKAYVSGYSFGVNSAVFGNDTVVYNFGAANHFYVAEIKNIQNTTPTIASTFVRNIQLQNLISIFPNPTSSSLTIKKSTNENLQFHLYNLIGQNVMNENLKNETTLIERNGLPANAYLFSITNQEGKIVQTGKIIFE